METGKPVRDLFNQQDQSEFLGRPRVSNFEKELGEGKPYFPIFATLFFTNSIVLAARFNKLQCRRAFFISAFGSLFLAWGASYLMGDSMYRYASKVDDDNRASSRLYEQYARERLNGVNKQ